MYLVIYQKNLKLVEIYNSNKLMVEPKEEYPFSSKISSQKPNEPVE